MEIGVHRQDEVRILVPHGNLEIGDPVASLRAAIEDQMRDGHVQIVLDLADVQMIDSSGMGAIIRALTSLKQRGGSLKLLNPSKFTLQTLKIVGLLNLFEVYEDEAQAVASYS